MNIKLKLDFNKYITYQIAIAISHFLQIVQLYFSRLATVLRSDFMLHLGFLAFATVQINID